MKKKLLAATVLAAMTLTTASVFAAPSFSGDANIEYNKIDGGSSDLTSRIRLSVDADIADNFYVHGRVVGNLNLEDRDNAANAAFNRLYLGAKFDNLNIAVGKQSLYTNQGILLDNEYTGVAIGTGFDNVNITGFAGKDLTAVELGTKAGNMDLSATYVKDDVKDSKVMGFYAGTQISNNAVLGFNYLKDNNNDTDGYLTSVKFGNALKKGDADYTLIYRDMEVKGDSRYVESKGFAVEGNYKVSDATNLNIKKDFSEDTGKRMTAEFEVKF